MQLFGKHLQWLSLFSPITLFSLDPLSISLSLAANFPTLSWLPQTASVVVIIKFFFLYFIFSHSIAASVVDRCRVGAAASGAALKMPLFVD